MEHQFDAVGNAELVKDILQVIFYGALADEEVFPDFFVLKALGDELNDFHLAIAEEQLFTTRTGLDDAEKVLITSAVMRLSSQISPACTRCMHFTRRSMAG